MRSNRSWFIAPDRRRRRANTGVSDNDIDPAAPFADCPDHLLHSAAIPDDALAAALRLP